MSAPLTEGSGQPEGGALIKLPIPMELRDNLAGLHAECWQLGECVVLVTRENVADSRNEQDFRWHLSISHAKRSPTMAEIKAARENLLADDLHFAMPFPHRAYDFGGGHSVNLWEIKDSELTEQWEFEAVSRRREGAGQLGS